MSIEAPFECLFCRAPTRWERRLKKRSGGYHDSFQYEICFDCAHTEKDSVENEAEVRRLIHERNRHEKPNQRAWGS